MADQTTVDQIIEYYTNLLIIQYNKLPNASATIALFIEQLVADGIYFDVKNGYNLDTAVGVQLDVLGKYIGVSRFFGAMMFEDYFSFSLYDPKPEIYTGSVGFCDYSDLAKPGFWMVYDAIVNTTYSLSDADYRLILKLKILQNNSNHSDKEIDDGIFEIFGDLLIPQDNYNMTMNYIVDPSIEDLINIAYNKGVLPKPMGVEIILLQSSA